MELKPCTVFVHLFCPLRNPFRDPSVSNANRTNPPEAKCSKLAPHALITPRTPRASRVMMLLYACFPHSRVMCNEMELKDLISPLIFAESLWRRLYLDIAVPKALVLSNYGLNYYHSW